MLFKANTIDDLLSAIEADKELTGENALIRQRYPIRFILFNDFSLFKEVIKILCQNNIVIKKIENELPFEDGWITRLEMKNLVESCIHDSNSDVVISPFSEIIRFYDDADFTSFFKEVSMLEANISNLNRRVYIPIIGLEHRLAKFKNLLEGAIIWELLIDKPKQYPIYVTQDYRIPLPEDITNVKTSKEWLELWRSNFPKKIIVCSSSPILNNHKNSQPDTIFHLEHIQNEYEFLLKIFNLKSSIHYKENDADYWRKMLDFFQDLKATNFSLDQFSLNYFNVIHFKEADFLRLWFNRKDDFSRWLLIRNFETHIKITTSYLHRIICQLDNFSDNKLIELICLNIFQQELTADVVEERDKLLKFIHIEKVPISEYITETLKQKISELLVSDILTALKLCSGTFDFEKVFLVKMYAEAKIKATQLQNGYPLLYDYLKGNHYFNLNEKQEWIKEYFKEYKNAKISNTYTNKIKELISLKNKDEYSFFEWYTPIRTPQSVLSSYNIDKFYWIDGLGMEWISLIQETIKKHENLTFFYYEVTKTNLPSTTETNSFPDFTKIGALDAYIHQNLYVFPDSIINEIDIVHSIIEDIVSKIHNQTIAIVSDHGLTALSRLVESKKFKFDVEHEGRYAGIGDNFNKSSEDYIVYTGSNKKNIVALKHASLGIKPIREAHGGCTPEEVLVPTIIISDIYKSSIDLDSDSVGVKTESRHDQIPEKGYEEIELF